ncbi:MAG: S24 family peptidase, partial [Planctomycetes bacterium]|nr:S24 family peptidase [Planctomycetota bacterium]
WSAEQGPYDPGDWSDEWVTYPRGGPFEPGMFVAQVVGDSMVPEINDRDFCLFRQPPAGSRQGKRLLIWHAKIGNDGQYTVKVYTSEKVLDRDGNWTHTKITLKPLNKAHQPIELTIRNEGEVRVIGEFVEVVGR